jgi:hypothetical protein
MPAVDIACECGEPAYYWKTGECRRCYHRRYNRRYYDEVVLPKAGKTRRPPRRAKPRIAPRPEGRPLLKVVDLHRPITYGTAHSRLMKWRGSAKHQTCVGCDLPADEWSYNGGGRHEMRGPHLNGWGKVIEVAWSTEVSDWSPRCRSCHVEHDRKTERCDCGQCNTCTVRARRARRRRERVST